MILYAHWEKTECGCALVHMVGLITQCMEQPILALLGVWLLPSLRREGLGAR